jgi:hypothetical protein
MAYFDEETATTVNPHPSITIASTTTPLSKKHIMISFNVYSSNSIAEFIYNQLRLTQHRDCWICTKNIPPGVEWRDAIQAAVSNSSIYICLITKAWIDSGECQIETKLALSLYTRNKEPKIIPVIFPDAKPFLQDGILPTLMATFNVLVIDDVSDVEGVGRKIIGVI